MFRILMIIVGAAVCIATLTLAVAQRRQLVSLRAQKQPLQTHANKAPPTTPPIALSEAVVATTEQHSPSLELLRLRGEVGQLERRKRELAEVRMENERLRVQLATKGTNVAGGIVLPAGYLRKADAKFMGYNSPEDTIQSMLWAIQNRDAAKFLQVFNPEMAKQLGDEIQRRVSPEEFFKEADSLPGLRVIGRESTTDDTIVLNVEMIPGDEVQAQKMRFKQIAGQWKLVSGL